MKCTKCGNIIPETYQLCPSCGTPRHSQGIYEPKIDLDDYRNKQNTYEQQQETIRRLEEGVVSDKKAMFIVFLISLGLFCIGFQLAYNQHIYWSYLFMFAGIGAICLFANVAKTQSKRKKELKLAKTNYQSYADSKEAEKREAQKQWAETARKNEENEKKKKEIEKRKAECRKKGIPCCSKCGSSSIATINRGYSMVSGFVGSGKPVNVCQMCGYKWQIGK